MKTPQEIAGLLAPVYGSDPSKVGANGHEDDFGDLIHDVVLRLGYNPDVLPEELWQKVMDAASASEATDLETFARELQEALR